MISVPVSAQFKSKATKAILSIFLFIIVYCLLFLLGIAAFIACCFGAYYLISIKAMIVTIGIGIGLIAVGFFILAFLVKFLFKKEKTDNSHLTEINEFAEPELFKMITGLVEEIGTSFPKRVYISSQVNASVFYDSTFWSMFIPAKKNLHIGIGLVNTMTVSELRGILAHEFGHFSQRSMRIGSYVHNVNKIIHNLLYENDGYDKAVREWSSKSNYFVVLISLAVFFNKFVQSILKSVYRIVNLNHLALSREMEFHADAVAVHVVGSEAMVTSMMRIDMASQALDMTAYYLDEKISESITTDNVFTFQLLALQIMGESNNLELQNGLPKVPTEFYERLNKSNLNITDQWASHPEMKERIAAYQSFNISVEINNDLANVLFNDIIGTQKAITKKMLENIVYPETPKLESLEVFKEAMEQRLLTSNYPAIFNNYYETYNIKPFDLTKTDPIATTTSVIFGNEMTTLIAETNAMTNDQNTLEAIANKFYDINSFDYEGIKFSAKDALIVRDNIEHKKKHNDEILEKNNLNIYAYCYERATKRNQQDELITLYTNMFTLDNKFGEKAKLYGEVLNNFSFVYQTLPYDTIKTHLADFKKTESRFMSELTQFMDDPLYKEAINNETVSKFKDYIDNPPVYFYNNKYDEKDVAKINEIAQEYINTVSNAYILSKRKLLDFKASLLQ